MLRYTNLQGSASSSAAAVTPDPSPCICLRGAKSAVGKSPREKGGESVDCEVKCMPKLSRTIDEGCNAEVGSS
jgi:hypothetical protein